MTEAEIRGAVLRSLHRIAPEVDPNQLDPDGDLREQVDLDSMDYMNFVLGVGQELGAQIPEGDYPELRTLNGCVGYLAARLRAAEA